MTRRTFDVQFVHGTKSHLADLEFLFSSLKFSHSLVFFGSYLFLIYYFLSTVSEITNKTNYSGGTLSCLFTYRLHGNVV